MATADNSMNKRTFALLAASALLFAGCGKMTEPFKDAPRAETNDSAADVLTFPDGFSNVATKCHGPNRVFVIYHQDAPYGSVAVVPNSEDCAR